MRVAATGLAFLLLTIPVTAGEPVAIDPGVEHQIIDGFGANQPQYYYATDYFGGAILDRAFARSGMGVSLLRCDMPLGFEGVEGTSAGNDNADPDVIDWDGFDKTVLDSLAAVAQGAATRGCEKFIATPWSPPYWMKDSNSETGGGSLLPGMEPELAEYFRAFLTYLSGGTGEIDPPVSFDHVTINNEPEIAPGWWGCEYTPSEYTFAMQYVGGMLATYFPSVTLAAGDNATTTQTLNYLATTMADPVVEPMIGILSVHPYNLPWGSPDSQSSVINRWESYRTQTLGYGRRTWQVEHCDADYPTPDPNRANWASGLNGATHLHRALVNGYVNAWSFWTLYRRDADLQNQGYGHALWYSEDADGNVTLKATGKVPALTPYYRYVRPGYKRVAASPSDASTDLRVTAFKAPGGVDDALVIVVINRGTAPVEMDVSITDTGSIDTLYRAEATAFIPGSALPHGVREGSPVSLVGGAFTATVPASSVTAFVHEAGAPWPTAQFSHTTAGLSLSVDATASTPVTIGRFQWDFGDESYAEGATAVHDYTQDGTYDVTLTVTEESGGVSTVTQPVIVSNLSLAGQVLYYRTGAGAEPGTEVVGDVTLDIVGETFADSTVSGLGDGSYSFADLPSEEITVTPARVGEIGGISSLDASLISQFRVGMIGLTPNQQIAADVSGNTALSSYDASLISQLRVGMIARFPVADQTGSDWAFVPGSRGYFPLDANLTGEDYLGVLYGDVTGNWTPGGRGAEEAVPPPRVAGRPVGLPPVDPGNRCTLSMRGLDATLSVNGGLAVHAEGCEGMLGLDLVIAYDPATVSIENVAAAKETSQFAVAFNKNDGLCRISMYSAYPLRASDDILVVKMARKAGPRRITLVSGEINEGRIAVRIENGAFAP